MSRRSDPDFTNDIREAIRRIKEYVDGLSFLFSDEAQRMWDQFPARSKELLFNNVWCPYCCDMTTIVELCGDVRGGNLVLEGVCVDKSLVDRIELFHDPSWSAPPSSSKIKAPIRHFMFWPSARSRGLLCRLLTPVDPSRRLATPVAPGQTDRPPRVMRTHLPAYARRIYVHAFRTGIGL